MKRLFLIFVSLILYQVSLFAQLEFWKDNQQFQKSIELPLEVLNVNIDSTMLDSILSDYFISETLPGLASLIIKENNVAWNKNYGFRNIELQLPVEDSTLFLMGSISKTILATAVMQLWENDLIDLNRNINNYLPPGFVVLNPKFPNDSITVKMLLTHSSSLQDDYGVLDKLYGCGDYPMAFDSLLVNYFVPGGTYYSSNNFYSYKPGYRYNYSNFGACLLALIVQQISSKAYAEYVDDNIFAPLSMYSSSFFLEGMDTSKIAIPYLDHPSQATCHSGFPYWPIGQLRTTKLELSNFASAYLNYGIYNNHKILDSSTIALMFSKTGYNTNFGGISGLIWMTDPSVYDTVWSHTGGWFGCETALYLCKEEKWGILLFLNWTTSTMDYSAGFFPVLKQMAQYAHLYGNIYAISPSIDKSYARKNIDSILFKTRFSNIYNHQFIPRLIYINTGLTEKDSLTLYDDGNHGDLLAGDRLYAGYIPPRTIEDYYTLSVSTIENITNKYYNTPVSYKFTTAGSVKLDSLPFGSVSGFRFGFKPFLKNAGVVQSITNVKLKLTSDDPWITNINPAERSYPNLLPGQTYGGSQIFTVTYDSATFPGYFNLRFSISSNGWSYWEIDTTIIVKPSDVEDEASLPLAYKLDQNYPNPFNPSTRISWQSPVSSWQTLIIYDVLGNEVATLVDEYKPAGRYEVEFDGSDLPSGVYFYQLKAGNFMETKKMILLR